MGRSCISIYHSSGSCQGSTCSVSFPLLGAGRLLTSVWQCLTVFLFLTLYILSLMWTFCGCSGVVGILLSVPEVATHLGTLPQGPLSELGVRFWNDHTFMPVIGSSSKSSKTDYEISRWLILFLLLWNCVCSKVTLQQAWNIYLVLLYCAQLHPCSQEASGQDDILSGKSS